MPGFGASSAPRICAVVLLCAVALHTGASTPAPSQPARVAHPVSLALATAAREAADAGDLLQAGQLYESAIVADPGNDAAFVGMGEIALAQGLAGQALGHFRRALEFDQRNRAAVAGEAMALFEQGAQPQARARLSALRGLCGVQACPELARAEQRMQRTAIQAEDLIPRPVVENMSPAR